MSFEQHCLKLDQEKQVKLSAQLYDKPRIFQLFIQKNPAFFEAGLFE